MSGKLVTLIGMIMTVVVSAVISQHMESHITVRLRKVHSVYTICVHTNCNIYPSHFRVLSIRVPTDDKKM